jgi:surface carbohydrate biosynthesis protein (TIGR04326 family)
MKRELSSIELFMVSKRQFRRSVLGPPALEALRLAHAFEDVILAYSPTAVLLPYENQLWQRVLAQLSQSRGIKVIGAVHSTARFWDLRLLRPQQFAEFFPTSYITNGPASETLLIGLGVPRSQLLQGTALRFSHLKANVTRELQLTSAGRILVVTGVNKTATARMITVIQQLTGLHSNDLTFRPHPAVTEWFRKKYPDLPIDDTDFSEAIRTYEAFICDSMSSLGFEFAACGKVVFVYKPEGELDFSPLKMVENFSSYFFHQKSFESIQHLPSRKFKLSEYLNVGGDRKIWSSLLRQIVD